MDVPGPERRLAAILAADMVGYSRLMEADEAGTLARLKTHRLELIDPAIAKNQGRIIKTTGDGMLVEFHSVADAVCAPPKFSAGWRDAMPMFRRREDPVPYRDQSGRRDRRRERYFRRRRQRRGTAGGAGRTRRICVSARCATSSATGSMRRIRGSRRADVKNIVRPIRVFRVRLEESQKPHQTARRACGGGPARRSRRSPCCPSPT